MMSDQKAGVKHTSKPKVLGTERMGGYECEKQQHTSVVKGVKCTTTIWYSKKLGHWVRVENRSASGTSVNYLKNIRVRSLPDSLFEVPKGYSKAAQNGQDRKSSR